MTAPVSTSYLVRLSPELTTKSRRSRRRFQEQLVRNLRDGLNGLGGRFEVRSLWDRLVVEAEHPGALDRIAGVFGVSSVSPIDAIVPPELERIVEVGHDLYKERVAAHATFAVRARRSGEHGFGSRDVAIQLGKALNQYAEVDLDDPEVEVYVEVRETEAFLFSERTEAVGGLPRGVEGKANCLFSGGFDSAVAAWLVLRRGVSLDYVFLNLAGDAYERMVASITKVLADEWSYGDRPRLHVVDFGAVVDDLRAKSEPRYWQVVLKRLMYRAAERVAAELRGEAIVTGEAIGQVSSQTLGNLRAIDAVATLPVFRPLLGFDKSWIIERAEQIGTAAISARVREYCAIAPDKPVTHTSPERVAAQETGLDFALLERAVDERKVLDLRALEPAALVEPYLFIDRVPEGAVVLDCRPSHQFRAWHYPGAEQHAPHDVATRLKQLSKERTYVLYCEYGVQTAHLAELLQRVGYEAYSFRGGAPGLRAWSARQPRPDRPSPERARASS
jgi:thiamine biosynthesis protein ThiI